MNQYKAIVAAHIWLDDKGKKEIEVLGIVHNDKVGLDVFCDVETAILEQIDIGDSDDYYFMAVVNSELVARVYWEGTEWDAEHEVIEIKDIKDITRWLK